MQKILSVFICAVLVMQLTGCGTIMYPERKGQKSGRIDSGVAILDGLGLLLFIIPGVIAFAVDFNNGTIYLPETHRSSLKMNSIKQVKFDAKHSTVASVEQMISEQTGQRIALDQAGIKISKLNSANDAVIQMLNNNSNDVNDKIAVLRK